MTLGRWVTLSDHQMPDLCFLDQPFAFMQGNDDADTDEATKGRWVMGGNWIIA